MDNLTATVLVIMAALVVLIVVRDIGRHRGQRADHLTWSMAGTAAAAAPVRNVCFMLIERGQHRQCPNCYAGAELLAEASQLPPAHGMEFPTWTHPASLSQHRGWLDPTVSMAVIVAESWHHHTCNKETCRV